MKSLAMRENIAGYLFIAPAVLIIGLFGLFPILYSLYMSVIDWRPVRRDWVGIGNFQKAVGDWVGLLSVIAGIGLMVLAFWIWNKALRSMSNRKLVVGVLAALVLVAAGYAFIMGWGRMLYAGDKRFLNSLPVTFFYSLGTVPAELAIGLVIAYLLFQKIRGKEFLRMLYFLPYITPSVATAVVFRDLFSQEQFSIMNQVLAWFGMAPQKWLMESRPFMNVMFGLKLEGYLAGPSMALVSIIVYGIWTFVGYNVVIFLAGLGSIPKETYEAADIDGANQWQMFRHVTIPLISPVTFYLALVAFIGTFKAFNHIYVMRLPSAQGTADVASIAIFDTFYKLNSYSYAAAQAIILFLIIAGLTYVQNHLFSEKVFYG
jgi:multiple sugar transport system permease protein